MPILYTWVENRNHSPDLTSLESNFPAFGHAWAKRVIQFCCLPTTCHINVNSTGTKLLNFPFYKMELFSVGLPRHDLHSPTHSGTRTMQMGLGSSFKLNYCLFFDIGGSSFIRIGRITFSQVHDVDGTRKKISGSFSNREFLKWSPGKILFLSIILVFILILIEEAYFRWMMYRRFLLSWKWILEMSFYHMNCLLYWRFWIDNVLNIKSQNFS